MKTKINTVLILLILLDFVLFAVCLLKPDLWVKGIHNTIASDSLGLIHRQGGVWAAFFIFQFLALFRWERAPYWLVLVAGIRLTEVFSDWIYYYFAPSLTFVGTVGLLIAPPVNLVLGIFFIKTFLRLSEGKQS